MDEKEKNKFFEGIYERVERQRIEWLFEEPCTYEDEDEDLDN